MTYVARGKTTAGEVLEATVEAVDSDDAKWQFAHGFYQTAAGQPMAVTIDYRTVRLLERRHAPDGA